MNPHDTLAVTEDSQRADREPMDLHPIPKGDEFVEGDIRSREMLQRIAERSVVPRRAIRYGEDMRSLTAGSLSASLGLVALVALVDSMRGYPGQWNVREYYGALIMSSVAAAVAIAGIILGWIGLRVGWRAGRRISIASAFGMASCYLAVVVSLLVVAYHELKNWPS